MKKTKVEEGSASSDPEDQQLLAALSRFAAGANLAIEEFRRGDRSVPDALALIYDPRAIAPGNTVSSTQIANVRVEQRGRGQQADAQGIGWHSRFFLNLLPI